MASLDYKSKKKTSYIRYRINGKMFRKKIGKVSKAIALKILHRFEEELALRNMGIASSKSVAITEFFETYLSFVEKEQAHKTYLVKKLARDHFIRFLNHAKNRYVHIIYLQDINQGIVEHYKLYRLNQKVSHRTINIELSFLSNCMASAKEWGYTTVPFKIKLLAETKKQPRFFSQVELKLMLENASNHLKQIVIISIFTGLRIGELLNLKWAHIDFENNVIRVTQSATFKTKTKRERCIPIHSRLSASLMYLQENHIDPRTNKVKPRTDQQKTYVICNRGGEQIFSVQKSFRRLLKKLNIQNASLHTLRHTFASMCMMNNVSLYVVKEFLGHSCITTTEIYTHANQEFQKTNMEKLSYTPFNSTQTDYQSSTPKELAMVK